MTRLPLDNQNVLPFTEKGEGAYTLNSICAAPDCTAHLYLERHHLWRRSFIIGDIWWVKLPDGTITGNCVNLCNLHHRDVTENIARISYDEESSSFIWSPQIAASRPLQWQPPVVAADEPIPVTDPNAIVHTVELHENECPTCHRSLPKPKVDSQVEEKRIRRTWSITVPMDEREQGADILDELLEGAREELARRGMAYGDTGAARYFVLSTALALFLTHVESLLGDE